MSVEAKIIALYNEKFPNIPKKLNDRLVCCGKNCTFDDIHLIELIMDIEDEFGIEISDDEESSIILFQDLVSIVEKHVYDLEVE